MVKLNVPRQSIHTHEGGKAKYINPEQQLRRSVMACLLWEKQFYEDGEDIAYRITSLIPHVALQKVADMAIEAREKMKLRHAPLLLIREMARFATNLVKNTLARVIQRPDELTEFLAIYWKDGKQPLSAQVKKGLAKAFPKFDAYQLAKYNRAEQIKLRDVLFLCHAKPKDADQAQIWKKLVENRLEPPDTWEVALSTGKDKKETWERLMKENRLGAMALLRNLKNMTTARVDESLIIDALQTMKSLRILPFRFIAAAKYAPQFEQYLEGGMLKCLASQEPFKRHTVLLIDVSGSMKEPISDKSEITRLDAACGVAMLAREICEKIDIFTFSLELVRIPARRGFALRDAITNSQEHSGTLLGLSTKAIYSREPVSVTLSIRFAGGNQEFTFEGQSLSPDRLIVITDEQSHDPVPDPKGKGYMINVASSKNGVGYGAWTHIDGWSEAVIDYIRTSEHSEQF